MARPRQVDPRQAARRVPRTPKKSHGASSSYQGFRSFAERSEIENSQRTLPHRSVMSNTHGESIMIDAALSMNQMATAIDHDREREKATIKAVRGNPSWASCSIQSAS